MTGVQTCALPILSSSCLVSAIFVDTSGIRRTDVSKFFEPSVKCIVNAVVEQRKSAHKSISVSSPLLATPLDKLSLTQVYVLARRARRWFRRQQLAIHQSPRITQTPRTRRSAARKPRVRPLSLPLPPFHTGSPLSFLSLPIQEQSGIRRSHLLLSRSLCPYPRLDSDIQDPLQQTVRFFRSRTCEAPG